MQKFGPHIVLLPVANLETTQATAGRQILGKSGASNVLTEAVLGDLGWMSIRSHLRLAKMRLFGRLHFLPTSSLPKKVFLYSQALFDANDFFLPPADRPPSWCNDVFTILSEFNLQTWWFQGLPNSLVSYASFQSTIKKHVCRGAAPACPSASGFSARSHTSSSRPRLVQSLIFCVMIANLLCSNSTCVQAILVSTHAR